MPRRLLAPLVISLAVLALVAARPLLFPPTNPRLTRVNFDRIKEGMKLADIEAILGPPGDYRTGPVDKDLQIDTVHLSSGPWSHAWFGDKAIILTWIDEDGTVYMPRFEPVEMEPVGLLALLRWRCDRWWWEHIRKSEE
jgi:hypothetical protein